jgi:hypothetical protein
MLGEERSVHRAHRAAHAIAEQGKLVGSGSPQNLPDRPWQVIEDEVPEVEILVLVAGTPQSREVDVSPRR